MKKLGFTLAEVLITLVIIGVIAAMTVPTLMNNTNAQEFRSGFKKAIAALNQALTLHYALTGTTAQDYSTGATALMNDVFKKRMSVITVSGTTAFSNDGVCSGSDVFTTADGMMFCLTNFSTTNCDEENTKPCAGTESSPNIYIDVNGLKGPNKLTTSSAAPRDIYQAQIYAQRVIPFGGPIQEVMYDKTNDTSKSNVSG